MIPIDGGCPHCGSAASHPASIRPTSPVAGDSSSANQIEAQELERLDSGKLAYDTWVTDVGHGGAGGVGSGMAVSWDKLTGRAREAWTRVARAIERRTVQILKQRQQAHEAELRRAER